MMGLRPGEVLIDDSTPMDLAVPNGVSRGLVPRDYTKYPATMFDPPSNMPLIPRSEWSARIKEKEQRKSRLSDIRLAGNGGQPIPSLDQDGYGYCWAHSTTATVMVQRAAANLPYVPLSAFAVAAIIKGYQNEGGWCGLSAQFARQRGIPSQHFWPQQSMNPANDNPQTWADAANHKITEDWVDLTVQVYDQTLTFDQVVSCLLSDIPVAVDFNWWSHSVCALDAVEVSAGSFGLRIWNSWSDTWGDRGMGVLQGQRAIPDGAVATRVTTANP
jgi:hypothetical protein